MDYLNNIDYLGTYNVDKTKKSLNLNFLSPGGSLVPNNLKTACARSLGAKKLFEVSGLKICQVLHCCSKFEKIFSTVSPLKRRTKAHFA